MEINISVIAFILEYKKGDLNRKTASVHFKLSGKVQNTARTSKLAILLTWVGALSPPWGFFVFPAR